LRTVREGVGCQQPSIWSILRRWSEMVFFVCAALVRLFTYGVGLSLICYWIISVAPVRGGHLLFFACRKEK
ncbi:hypothetical protein, partial [Paraburkholderia solitsugae]|uniref:hypothetical protein n=1 Tax=Paraburkholderia solitsugae TaxID=2675748 RepID=UPI001C131B48